MTTQLPEGAKGTDLTRVVAFTDGVFAIAITLLVLNFDLPDVPDSEVLHELTSQWPSLLAYMLSFAVIGRFWLVHHRVFAGVRSFDRRLLRLNLLYLALVVLVPFTTEVLGEHSDTSAAVFVYAIVLGLAATVNWLMIRHLVQRGHVDPAARAGTEPFGGAIAFTTPAVFLLSAPIGLVSPLASEMLWVALGLLWPVRTRIHETRARETSR